MTYPDIRFHSPRTVAGAVKLLAECENARVLAGGTDLLIDLKEGSADADHLISLQAIEELKGIEERDGWIEIGSMATAKEIAGDSRIKTYNPALADAARRMASSHIRAVATVGGNIASAVPSADLPAPLIAADAEVRLFCSDGERESSLSSFFTGPREMICGRGEILAAVRFPIPPPETGLTYERFALRDSNALAVAAVAARLTLEKGRIRRAAVVLTAVAPTPLLANEAGERLSGREPSPALFSEAALLAREACRPISDVRGSAWFRAELVEILTRRALARAAEHARQNRPEREILP